MTIEPNKYNILKEHNYELKEQVDNLRQDLQNRCDRCIELNDEKRYWLDNFKRLRDDKIELKKANEKLQDEHEQLKQRVLKLVRTNTTLQNDLFSEQLLQDETDDYINRLKQELFSEHLKQVETEYFIDKLKKELKEYRGF